MHIYFCNCVYNFSGGACRDAVMLDRNIADQFKQNDGSDGAQCGVSTESE